MILRNWMNFCNFYARSTNSYYLVLKNTKAQTYNCPSWDFSSNATCNGYGQTTGQPSCSRVGLALGSGTTAPTINDYKMESPVTTLTSGGVTSTGFIAGTTYANGYYLEFSQTVANNTADDITISELGLYSNNADGNATYLFSRDVITPVKIAVGETKIFTVSIDMTALSSNVSVN